MPRKNVLLLTEVALIAIVWSACENSCTRLVTSGLTWAVNSALPVPRLAASFIVTAILMAVLYMAILLADRVDIGRNKVFEVARE